MPTNSAIAIVVENNSPDTISSFSHISIAKQGGTLPASSEQKTVFKNKGVGQALVGKNFLPQETDDKTDTEKQMQSHFSAPDKKSVTPFPKIKSTTWEIPREITLQEWEGQVLSIHPDEGVFIAALTDMTAKESIETEEAEFPISDLSDSDSQLLEEGAIFRWIIGYEYRGTQRRRFSRTSFRNLPQWNEAELLAADKEAERLNAIEYD